MSSGGGAEQHRDNEAPGEGKAHDGTPSFANAEQDRGGEVRRTVARGRGRMPAAGRKVYADARKPRISAGGT
ncbi:hypothetical protein Busp01_18960 [Trinickia caryophylli]|nr:hypothetical protein Busp01_18960 [Trinickia caryophylli]